MIERCAEVLPEGRVGAGVIGGEEEGEHIDEACDAGGASEESEDEAESDGEFSVGDEQRDGRRVREDETAEHGNHEGIGAFLKEAVDPKLEASVKDEGSAEDFVFAEDDEEKANADA